MASEDMRKFASPATAQAPRSAAANARRAMALRQGRSALVTIRFGLKLLVRAILLFFR